MAAALPARTPLKESAAAAVGWPPLFSFLFPSRVEGGGGDRCRLERSACSDARRRGPSSRRPMRAARWSLPPSPSRRGCRARPTAGMWRALSRRRQPIEPSHGKVPGRTGQSQVVAWLFSAGGRLFLRISPPSLAQRPCCPAVKNAGMLRLFAHIFSTCFFFTGCWTLRAVRLHHAAAVSFKV